MLGVSDGRDGIRCGDARYAGDDFDALSLEDYAEILPAEGVFCVLVQVLDRIVLSRVVRAEIAPLDLTRDIVLRLRAKLSNLIGYAVPLRLVHDHAANDEVGVRFSGSR